MPRTKRGTPPSYRRHSSGQAIVTLPLPNGKRKDVLLGPHGSPDSYAEYRRVLAEWEVNGRRLPAGPIGSDITMNELMLRYLDYADGYYVKDGKATSEPGTIRQFMGFIRETHGHGVAREFSPQALKAIRLAMIKHPITRTNKVKDPVTGKVQTETRVLRQGLARKLINKQVGRIKRMFGWAVEEELVPVAAYQALLCVKGLKKGKSEAREKPRIKPPAEAFIDSVLPLVPVPVRGMIELQRLSGCRPQDVVSMRGVDIDMTDPIWEYRPQRYKTEHHNDNDNPDRERVVFLGPRAQATLKPFLSLNVSDYLFSPSRSERTRNAKRREQRQSPMTPSQAKRRYKKRKAPIRDHYDVASYRRAIRRACIKAGVPIWFPLQLRHSAGTIIRKRYGLEASQACLGHKELGVTQVYAEVDRETARRVMGEIG